MSARVRRPKVTVTALRAMPLAQRYDAVREVIERRGEIGDECLDAVFRDMCIRRTWPKDREHPSSPCFGSANRWNFNPDPKPDYSDHELPPSLKASSPDALYRLMHVVEPARLVAKSRDYYKGGVFRFYSADRRYVCWVGFHKCEVDLTFYCPRGDLFVSDKPEWPASLRAEPKTEEEARNWYAHPDGGWSKFLSIPENRVAFDAYRSAEKAYHDQGIVVPWCSGRMRCKRPAGQAWMRLIVAVANTPWDIYPGNNFKV